MTEDRSAEEPGATRPIELTATGAQALLQILIHGPQPRVALAARLGLSRAQLTRVTADLLQRGIVVEGEPVARETRGRPAEALHVRPAVAHFAGVKLTGDRLYFVIVDLAATIVYESQAAIEDRAVSAVVAQIREELAAAITQTGIFPVGLGVAVAGDVVEVHGQMMLERSNFLGWDRVPLIDLLVDAVDLPTTVANDINALAGAHHWFGAGAPPSMVVYGVGAGVGSSVVVGGNVITGSRGRAGRVGHDFVGGTGLPCSNGHSDCVHSFVTIPAIEHNSGVAPGEYDLALERARGGERRASGAFRAAAVALGIAVAEAVNVLDPDAITIMGEGTDMLDLHGKDFRTSLADRLERGFPDEVTIERPDFHFDLYARGAAVAAIRELLS